MGIIKQFLNKMLTKCLRIINSRKKQRWNESAKARGICLNRSKSIDVDQMDNPIDIGLDPGSIVRVHKDLMGREEPNPAESPKEILHQCGGFEKGRNGYSGYQPGRKTGCREQIDRHCKYYKACQKAYRRRWRNKSSICARYLGTR